MFWLLNFQFPIIIIIKTPTLMERNEDHPFMTSLREQQNPDILKADNNPDISKMNDISS